MQTDFESGSEGSEFEDYIEKEAERDQQKQKKEAERDQQKQRKQQQQVSAKIETRAATSSRTPKWGPPQGTKIQAFVGPAKGKKQVSFTQH